ncbi:MAG: tetratricopeptide repeat protein [Hyphomonadaceae bacterium]|nr:tetratricopeptide repeat protein [Hyphomonadaceae bacterium]
MNDLYGNPVSTRSAAALAHYNLALERIRLYRGDPVAALDAALEEDPGLGAAWAARAGLLVQQTDAAYADEVARSLEGGAAAQRNPREAALLAAAQAWAEGRFGDGTVAFARVAQEAPRDLFALQSAHVGAFFLGWRDELRDWPLQALRASGADAVGHHAVLGMAAFGLEECGDYARAEALGGEAVALEPLDAWAVHAVAHVHEMRGDLDRGVRWLETNAAVLTPDSGLAVHNWWHLALLHVDRGDAAAALQVYDAHIRPDPERPYLLESVDAAALLWRLHLEGVDVGGRFETLAPAWARAAEDAHYAFNDLHAAMTFAGAGRMDDLARLIAAMRGALSRPGDNADMTRTVGLPLVEAIQAFAQGRYAACVDAILRVRGHASRFGGSHAQRDVLTLTALHAALRGGLRSVADALAAERLAQKPHSPWAHRLAARARTMTAHA